MGLIALRISIVRGSFGNEESQMAIGAVITAAAAVSAIVSTVAAVIVHVH